MNGKQMSITLETVEILKRAFEHFEDNPNNAPFREGKHFFKSIDDILKFLNEIGMPENLSPKEAQLFLEALYNLLKNEKEITATTLSPNQLEILIKQAEKRERQKTQIKEREKEAVRDYIKAQQEIGEEIKKAEAAQEKLKDKVIYAKVIISEPLPLDEIEKKDLEILREFATANEDTRTKLIDDLEAKIESKLEGVPEEQKELIARTTAVEIVEKLAKPEAAIENEVQTAVLAAIHGDENVLPRILQGDDVLLTVVKNGSTRLELEHRNKDFFTKDVTKSLFGSKLTEAIYGSSQIQVILSETKIERQTTHEVDLGVLNQNQIQVLNHQSELLNSIKQVGFDKAGSVFTNYARSYMAKKIAKLPAGSIVKKAYSDPIIQSIFARYGLANPIAWQAVRSSPFVNLAMKFAPETAGPLLSLAGRVSGKEFVKPVVGRAAGQAIAKGAAQVAVKKGVSGLIAKGVAFFAGLPAGPIGWIAGIVGGEVLSRIIENISSKLKVWWTKNKENIKPFLAIFVGGLGLMIGGPVVGLVGLGLGLAATGTLGSFALGAFNLFSVIGKSIAITIATPVIITLLALPPLVAFIMLVINNSAYVVPPSPLSTTSSNPYIEVLKFADPKGPFQNNDLPLKITYTVTIKAKRENLTNIKISDTCRIVQEASTIPCDGPKTEIPQSISPSSPFTFTYTNSYNKFTTNAIVVNTIEVTADVQGSEKQSSVGFASITIGEPPSNCLKPSGDWPSDKMALVLGALETIRSKYPSYLAKICESYPSGVPFAYERSGSGDLWGYWSNGKITFYPKGLENNRTAIYVVAHELLHVLMSSKKYYPIFKEYENIEGMFSEIPRCFYKYDTNLKEERLAEAVAFSIMPIQACSLGGNSDINRWPKHRDFVLQKILR